MGKGFALCPLPITQTFYESVRESNHMLNY
jgi:hypothetical protein